MKQQRKKGWKIAGLAFLGLLIVILLVPYLIPLSKASLKPEQLPFENSRRADIRGISFHYRVYAPTLDPVRGKVLMVHGLGGSTFSYEQSAAAFASAGWLCIVADLPGFGFSERDAQYKHAQDSRAEDLWLLLDMVDDGLSPGLGELQWHLTGHSMGGGTVAAMAIRDAARAAGLILIDPALFGPGDRSAVFGVAPVTRLLQVTLERVLLTESGVRRFLRSAYGREPTAEEVRGYLVPLTVPGTARTLPGLLKTSDNFDPAPLSQIDVPILAVWGSEDTWVPPSEGEKLLVIRPDASIRVIEGAAHCPMETHPEEFIRITLAFLVEHSNQ